MAVNGEGWLDDGDAQTVSVHYPTVLPATKYEGMAYITPGVKLELGAHRDPWRTEQKAIRRYSAESPGFLEDPDANVVVLSARRTFLHIAGWRWSGLADLCAHDAKEALALNEET